MTDSGQAPKIPPDPQPPAVPDWAPTQAPGSAAPPAAPTPDPYAVEATMRLLPIQHVPPPATSAPPSPTTPMPAALALGAPGATERGVANDLVAWVRGQGGMGAG